MTSVTFGLGIVEKLVNKEKLKIYNDETSSGEADKQKMQIELVSVCTKSGGTVREIEISPKFSDNGLISFFQKLSPPSKISTYRCEFPPLTKK